MRTIAILTGIFIWALNIQAQDRPVFLPEDVEAGPLAIKCFCKPGVENKSRSRGLDISYLHSTRHTLDEEDGFPLSNPLSELSKQNIDVKLRFPIVNKENMKVIGGLIYHREFYDFERIGNDYENVFKYIDGRTLKSTAFEAIMIKSWDEKFYSTFRVRTSWNGDYSGLINIDSRYAIYTFTGLLGIKRDDYKEWGIGLNFSSSFRNSIVLPFILYNQTFNEKWGIETVLPALINVRYNLNPTSILLAGIRYNSRSYSIALPPELDDQIFDLNHSEVRATFTLEQQLRPWVWLDLSAGFQYNFSTDFDAPNDGLASFQVEPGSAPFVKIGLFISPPDSFMK